MVVASKTSIKIADETWIIAALLHRDYPDRSDFSIEEIVERAKKEAIVGPIRAGLYVHVVQHCVANRQPNPARYRMLFETSPGRRRLFRKGDAYHPAREGAKIIPNSEDLPHSYHHLLAWYRDWSSAIHRAAPEADPLLALVGSGKHIWDDEHADDYIHRLRQGWE